MLVLQLIAALVFVGYTLIKKEIQLPVQLRALLRRRDRFPTPPGLDPAQGAGRRRRRRVGRAGSSRSARRAARRSRRCGSTPSCEGKIFADATASLRPINVLQMLIVNIDPGDPATGPLPEGQPIAADRTTASSRSTS